MARSRFHIFLDQDVVEMARAEAKRRNVKVGEVYREAIDDYFARKASGKGDLDASYVSRDMEQW